MITWVKLENRWWNLTLVESIHTGTAKKGRNGGVRPAGFDEGDEYAILVFQHPYRSYKSDESERSPYELTLTLAEGELDALLATLRSAQPELT